MGKVKELLDTEGYIFSKHRDRNNTYDTTNVRVSSTYQSTLPELLEAFEEFLRASGFYFKGHVDIVNDEEV